MPTWNVPATVLAVRRGGEIIRLRVDLGAGVQVDADVRLAVPGHPRQALRPAPAALAWVRSRLPPGTPVWFVSDRLDRDRRPMGRLMFGLPSPGSGRRQDLAARLLEAGYALPPLLR